MFPISGDRQNILLFPTMIHRSFTIGNIVSIFRGIVGIYVILANILMDYTLEQDLMTHYQPSDFLLDTVTSSQPNHTTLFFMWYRSNCVCMGVETIQIQC